MSMLNELTLYMYIATKPEPIILLILPIILSEISEIFTHYNFILFYVISMLLPNIPIVLLCQ